MKTVAALVLAAITFAIVAFREWGYRQAHPYAHGVSAELIALGIAGAVVAVALATYVSQREESRRETEKALWRRLSELQQKIDGLNLSELELRELEQDLADADAEAEAQLTQPDGE